MARKFKYTPEQIWNKYQEYKKELKNNYFIKYDVIRSGDKAGQEIEIKIPEPEMIEGFCLFMNISLATFYLYANKETKEDKSNDLYEHDNDNDNDLLSDNDKNRKQIIEVFTRIQTSIKKHQLAGALNQVYNQQIAARINGLKDNDQTVQINIEPVLHKVTENNSKLKLN